MSLTRGFLLTVGLGCLIASAQIAKGFFFANGLLPDGYFVLSSDDLPAATTFYGKNNALTIAENLHQSGTGAALFIVTCHFGQNVALSPMCPAPENEPVSILDKIADYGDFTIGNHTRGHRNLELLTAAQIHEDVNMAQQLLAPYQQNLGLLLFRCPYLSCGQQDLLSLRQDPQLSRFAILDADVKTLTLANGTVIGVDWDCWELGISEDSCSDMYLQEMRKQKSGFVLTHARTQMVTGYAGDIRPVNFHAMLVSKAVAVGMQLVPPDAVPGLLGNVRATGFTAVSQEFGSGDGNGPVVFADISGNGLADACKAFGQTIRCMLFDKDRRVRPIKLQTEFFPSTAWFVVTDPAWVTSYGQKFWLVDFDSDGKDDLVIPGTQGTQNGFWVARSDGASFRSFGFWPMQFGGWTSQLLQSIRFADIDHDGHVDVIAQVGGHIVWSAGHSYGFDSPKVLADLPAGVNWSDPKYGATLLTGDINGDGQPDLCIRGSLDVFVSLNSGAGKFTPFTSWSRRFPDLQGWDKRRQYQTLAIAKIGGRIGLAGGAATGIVFHEADPARLRYRLYRYLNNEEFSVVPGWHPEAHASQLSFARFSQGDDDWPVLVKSDGIYVAPAVVVGERKVNDN